MNSEKSYLGQISFAPSDKFSVATSVLYGAEGPATIAGFGASGTTNGGRTGLVDLLANYTGDHFSAWADADYSWIEGTREAAWALAIAGKVPITEVFSAALRLEYLRDQAGFLPILGAHHSEIYGATGTLAYMLAENLTLKTEVRWDRLVESAGGFHEFASDASSGHGTEDQVVGIAQVVYAF